MTVRAALACCAAVLASACGHDALLGSQCPAGEPSCALLDEPGAGTGAGSQGPSGGMAAMAVTITITDGAGWPTSAAQVTCAAPCIDVAATVSGNSGPVELVWSDGELDASRRLCPSIDSSYTIEARDQRDRPLATASLVVAVTPCPQPGASIDASMTPDASVLAGCDLAPILASTPSCTDER